MLLEYLNEQNRPFSVQNLVDNMRGMVKKAGAQKALDSLVSKGKITLRESGKAKIYYARQDQFETPSAEELAALDAQSTELGEELEGLTHEKKDLEREVSALGSMLTDEEIVSETARLETENTELSAKLESIKSEGQLISPEERHRIQKAYQEMMGHWKRRKRMCVDVLRNLSEGADKSVAALIDEMGVDTDESAGYPLSEYDISTNSTSSSFNQRKPTKEKVRAAPNPPAAPRVEKRARVAIKDDDDEEEEGERPEEPQEEPAAAEEEEVGGEDENE